MSLLNKLKKVFMLRSVTSKLLIFIYLDILVLSVFLGIFAYKTAKNLTIKDVGISQQQFVKEISRMISHDLNGLQNYMEIILYDKGLNEVLMGKLINSLDDRKYKVEKQIQMQIGAEVRNNGLIGALVIVNKEEGALSYVGSFSNVGFREDLEDYIRAQVWYKKTIGGKIRASWLGFEKVGIFNNEYDNKEYLSFLMAIPDVNIYPNFNCIGATYVVLNQDFFVKKLNNLVPELNRIFFICDNDGRMVASSGNNGQEEDLMKLVSLNKANSKSPEGYFSFTDKTGEFLVAYSYNEQYRLHFYETILIKDIVRELQSVTNEIIKIILICSVIFFAVIFFEVKKILNPLKSLFTTILNIKEGNLHERVYYERHDEIGKLGGLFNEMMDEINRVEKERARHEFESLQAQITPHFLYNTLNTIRMMAINRNANDIRFAITSLIKLFRSTYGKGGPLITLREELEILNHYIHLQQIRYSNKFQTSIQVSEDLMDLSVIKLILQPIVENAIFYGVSSLQSNGMITVEGFREQQQLTLQVRDNGKGMPVELIDEVLKKDISNKEKFSSIGLYSINQRIKLHFGEKFGIQIESEENKGTCVKLRLPLVYKKENREEK